jgi:Zn-dependent peptidase ImmA (M78 family)
LKQAIEINGDAIALRRELGEDTSSPIDIFALIGSISDLSVVYLPMSDNISGMSVKDEDIKLIAINSNMSIGRQRFTVAHELCHLYYHDNFKTIICSKNLVGKRNSLEKEADQFASYFLAPYEALTGFIRRDLKKSDNKLTLEDIVCIEQYFGMSHQATLVRLQLEKMITNAEAESFKKGVMSIARRLGYSSELYASTNPDNQYRTMGNYIRLADELNEKRLISSGKYEEFLLDAFRADIVYGDNITEEHYD